MRKTVNISMSDFIKSVFFILKFIFSGPMKLNGCPMRRINQIYLLATETALDVSAVTVPENVNDEYFKHARPEKVKKEGGDIFTSKKEEYKPSEQRKTDQAAMDAAILEVIKKHPEAAALKSYFKATFQLSKGQYPHKMAF